MGYFHETPVSFPQSNMMLQHNARDSRNVHLSYEQGFQHSIQILLSALAKRRAALDILRLKELEPFTSAAPLLLVLSRA